MDEEDLADAADSAKIQTAHAFAGLGSTEHDKIRAGGSLGLLLPPRNETMGFQLLSRMGWKDGQGIGPKIRRTARLGTAVGSVDSHLFAPDDVPMIGFMRKLDRKGLGFMGEAALIPIQSSKPGASGRTFSDGEPDSEPGPFSRQSRGMASAGTTQASRGGIGVGILNDTGSDEEDMYEIGPRISYSRVLGGVKKDRKKKSSTTMAVASPNLKSKPKLVLRKSTITTADRGLRKCHDGRSPLTGFVLGQYQDKTSETRDGEAKYLAPTIPPGWKSAKQTTPRTVAETFIPTRDAAKASELDPKARATLLGEKQLPGKSVFDYLTPAGRERLAVASGRSDLPPARGEVPAGHALSEKEKVQDILDHAPKLERQTALAVLSRGMNAGSPFGDDEAKKARYVSYVEFFAGEGKEISSKPSEMAPDSFAAELREFYNCARIFKPMTGFMASRFTTSSNKPNSEAEIFNRISVTIPQAKPTDSAEEAAKLGMYGNMTRSKQDFYPSRLLCKRFNVGPPGHVQLHDEPTMASAQHVPSPELRTISDQEARGSIIHMPTARAGQGDTKEKHEITESIVSPTRNETTVKQEWKPALESQRVDNEIFKAVFGDSSDEET
jgi:G patch domain-containing protein 1